MRVTEYALLGSGIVALCIFGCGERKTTGNASLTADGASDASVDTGASTDTVEHMDIVGQDVVPVAPSNLVWGNVNVRIADTQPSPTGLTVTVVDQATPPALNATLQYPSTTMFNPTTDGASVIARYTCRAPGLIGIELNSCANPNRFLTTSTTGCVAVNFNEAGTITGNFIHPTGARCDVNSGQANLQVPPPNFSVSPDAAPPPPDVAIGTFKVECAGAPPRLQLEGTFAIPLERSFLLCSES